MNATDRDDSWLVQGRPVRDSALGVERLTSYVFLAKASAEVVGLGKSGRRELTAAENQALSTAIGSREFQALYRAPPRVEPGGQSLALALDLNNALHGGLINSKDAALRFARVLMQLMPDLAAISGDAISIEERDGAWHICRDKSAGHEVLAFSRRTARCRQSKYEPT